MGAMTTQSTRRRRPTGRRAGDSGTRDAILDAARDLFAAAGYDGTSVRAIAGAADVDPALIRHFFGDKDTLFATVVADRTTIPHRLAESLLGDTDTLGQRVADVYLRLWEEPETRPVLMALVRSASTSERIALMLRETLDARLRPELNQWHSGQEQEIRLGLAASHLFGLAFARHVIAVPAIAALDHDELIAQIAPTIHRYLTGTHH